MKINVQNSYTQERVKVLDGWRGIAVLMLLAGHFVPHLGLDAPSWSVNFGRVGVELFFALSGCLMGRLLFERDLAFGKFAVRRFARIVPSMWAFLFVVYIVTWAREKPLPIAVFALNFVGCANLIPLFNAGEQPTLLGHFWSVCVELQGYVLLGGLAAISRYWRINPAKLIGAVIAMSWITLGIKVGQGTSLPYSIIFQRPDYRLSAMLIAALLIVMHDLGRLRLNDLPSWQLVLAAGLLLQVNLVPDVLKYTIGSALIALSCAGLSKIAGSGSRWLSHSVLVAFGTVSYSIYLWQQIFYAGKSILPWPVALTLAVLAGFAAHHLWDGWLHRWTVASLDRGLAQPIPLTTRQ